MPDDKRLKYDRQTEQMSCWENYGDEASVCTFNLQQDEYKMNWKEDQTGWLTWSVYENANKW